MFASIRFVRCGAWSFAEARQEMRTIHQAIICLNMRVFASGHCRVMTSNDVFVALALKRLLPGVRPEKERQGVLVVVRFFRGQLGW